jgi:hypothetical protein
MGSTFAMIALMGCMFGWSRYWIGCMAYLAFIFSL